MCNCVRTAKALVNASGMRANNLAWLAHWFLLAPNQINIGGIANCPTTPVQSGLAPASATGSFNPPKKSGFKYCSAGQFGCRHNWLARLRLAARGLHMPSNAPPYGKSGWIAMAGHARPFIQRRVTAPLLAFGLGRTRARSRVIAFVLHADEVEFQGSCLRGRIKQHLIHFQVFCTVFFVAFAQAI